MQTSAFDINTMLKDIAVFDQAITASTANMKVNFDVQIAGISQSFNATFAAIDVATLNSSLLLSANFTAALALLNAELIATQMISDSCFGLMSINAMNYFITAAMGIIGTLSMLNTAVAACCMGMEVSFSTSLLAVTATFSINLALINTLWSMGLALMLAATTTNATAISATMLGAFALITTGLLGIGTVALSVLALILMGFSAAAENAKGIFAGATININQNLTSIESQSVNSTGNASSGWSKFSDTITTGLSVLSNCANIFKFITGIQSIFTVGQAAATGATVAQTGATVAQTGATAAAGVTFTSAAVGALAFGAGVLLAGTGLLAFGSAILLVATAFALMAKVAFNTIKLLGFSTNGVKASDFDLKFSIPGLASGGFPSMGQMFIAREAGPELVGTIGSRTAVANNYQIEEGIARAVTRAMNQASLGGNWIIQLVDEGGIKSETIISAAERRNRRDGRTIIPLGV